ncbi:MAG: BolA family transcriptional regulator [Alphaproteobacteria bacterium]|nr:BolA family transcriptional regulator [Rhodospirillaceae bacterium]MDG2480643.1 BolA family transcriptional regulator [Alphaproteobacteria bacterium]MBT6202982.1 BolA family transcriptional regulator [Rhodospirillaceae bacterium]MBT6512863.1 BolA family transcriptional regulator [Rhodospirillaceae bacterium]MBT7614800.1 BolA family transcriptional regulator [Rhodospirillaceae bacterium]
MRVATAIRTKLEAALAPDDLEIIDESHLHAGHAGARDEGESHFRVRVVASAFDGLNRVARQRLIYKALADEMASDIHALAIDAKAPGEVPAILSKVRPGRAGL